MKAAHKQVKEDQVTIRGDLYALECKIESRIDAITKDLEHSRKPTAPRFYDLPDLPDMGVTPPPRKGTGEPQVSTSTGKIKIMITNQSSTRPSSVQRRKEVSTHQHLQYHRFPISWSQYPKLHGDQPLCRC